jgi:hypothetical protein
VKQSRNIDTVPFDRLSAADCRNEQDRGAKIQIFRSLASVLLRVKWNASRRRCATTS